VIPTAANRSSSMLAEGALRNLHLDCAIEGAADETFSSRMLHFDEGILVIADLSRAGSGRSAAMGDRMICSCRLGSDIVRFTALVADRRLYQLNPSKRIPALILTDLSEPALIRRRRYFRISLARHESAYVTLWLVQVLEDRSVVCGELHGAVADISGGGAGVVVRNAELLKDMDGKELWARFMLPGENESLIFRVTPRHVKYIESSRTYHVGLEFDEYVDPGRRQRVIDDIVRYVSTQQRIELKRRKDR